MLHRSALEDEARPFHTRQPSGPLTEAPLAPLSSRPSSRSSRPSSRNRMAKSGAVTPTGLGVVTENGPELHPESLKMSSPIKEGLGSLNRWSQSTTSSKSPSEYTGHRRGSSKMSISGHSPHRARGLGELPELDLPEFKTSDIFSTDSTASQLDFSYNASGHIFQNSANDLKENARSYQPDYMTAHASEGASSSVDGEGEADRQHGQTQKAMLSKALQKANTAVLLDNAANFEGAMEAYTDACQLLQLVMLRSNGGDEEKLKLQEIRDTYMIRITELQRMDFPLPDNADKALPERPISQESYDRLPPNGSNTTYNGQYLDTSAQEINESTSWLDTIDESGASSPSSAHSKASSVYLRQRTSRRISTDTEAEFDAALDAAVEAAYDEGLEPVFECHEDHNDDVVANARRNIELAKQRVREAELEAEVAMNRGREMRRIQEQNMEQDLEPHRDSDYLDEEAEEEERLLEEMTKGYVMDDFEFGIQSKSALPRESDSSNISGRTWESSAASNITSIGATLSTLTEDDDILPPGQRPDRIGLPSSPPSVALPPIPLSSDFPALPAQRFSLTNPPSSHYGSASRPWYSSASGLSFSTPSASRPPPPLPKDDVSSDAPKTSMTGTRSSSSLHPSKRNPSVSSFVDQANLAKARTHEDDELGLPPLPLSARPIGKVPSAPDGLDKINSDFNAFRNRNVSVSNPETATAPAPGSPTTPWSGSFPGLDTQKATMAGSIPVMPTPTVAYFTQNGALGRPNSLVANAPLPLEPCPESFLLRPFWLMRCLYQTLAHPHGGYLSAKLFVPRDAWRVKNIKIKCLEDKVSNCDLLTAALLKLARVDTYDADAVLEEMQSLESVLDQVQTALSKKLGHEVGVHTSMPLFRSNPLSDDGAHPDPPPSRTSGTSNKSYLPTWKRLRAKTSGNSATPSATPSARESNKDSFLSNSLPMAPGPTPHAKRNVTQLEFSGPSANYMGALARLFDAAQIKSLSKSKILDSNIHPPPTLVSELSTRHAAEFFGFYVCRFALADLGMMLDKYIKRGSEHVLI
ncbi:uncharacterized protein N7477_004811 [Penicillium maclennaniae]|uniref:uncharacterized protein n=1 Tax=Penicillium maclennaniae TaxID=1343394 RepID=UPI002540DAFB|nr:uncharacterized protein N7477_004811 [Penicillium maclennaniae]KAJ5674877.1 hypothetical protein N7477_004811 [Penicillium maclennaniae]